MLLGLFLAQFGFERHHPVAHGSRYIDPQPNGRGSQGNPTEDSEEERQELEQ